VIEVLYSNKPGVRAVNVVIKTEKDARVMRLFRWPEMAEPEVRDVDIHRFYKRQEAKCCYSPTGYCSFYEEIAWENYSNRTRDGLKIGLKTAISEFIETFGQGEFLDISEIKNIETFLKGDIKEEVYDR